jgi:hypothetical protein
MNQATIRKQAGELARANKEAEPAIEKVYWFPSDAEIRLVELEATTVPALSGWVEPFFFGPSQQDGLTVPSGIAIIQTKEFGKLKLPEGWGSWSDAVELDLK